MVKPDKDAEQREAMRQSNAAREQLVADLRAERDKLRGDVDRLRARVAKLDATVSDIRKSYTYRFARLMSLPARALKSARRK
jgi:tetrahydromethanopterin S-methyltransferase subunit B